MFKSSLEWRWEVIVYYGREEDGILKIEFCGGSGVLVLLIFDFFGFFLK